VDSEVDPLIETLERLTDALAELRNELLKRKG
jgi:hypothetical protein